jgi:hypothetical protein
MVRTVCTVVFGGDGPVAVVLGAGMVSFAVESNI